MKKIIKRGIVLIIILFCAFLYAHIDKLTYLYDRNIDTENFVNTGVIVDSVISQTFTNQENSLDGIQAKCSITGDVTDVQIVYTLVDLETDEVIAKGTKQGLDIKNNRFNKFEFEQVTKCRGKNYKITFEEQGADETNGISFYIVPEIQKNMQLNVKGNSTQGIMVARMITHRFDVETFGVILIFVAYIAAFMKLLYKLFK